MTNELMAIGGALLTFLLSVNAYYFKDIVKTLTEIKVSLAEITVEHKTNVMLLQKHDVEIDKLRERVHNIEGYQPKIVEFLEKN